MPDTFIGQEIDGYRILEELGRGGMGVVYKAEDVALARPVALKMIARDLARDASFERRFRSEARALARIDSPHITRIYALRRTEAGLFIVMEYIGGGTISDRMDFGPLKWTAARPLVLEMIAALEHAHGVGVVHRDIKPGNILLSEAGRVKVTDFGLAKLRTGDSEITVTQGIAGTLYYMSPEQVKGERTLDGRSDLYALGMTIYEMLSGRLPFERGQSEFETMRTIVEMPYPPLAQFAPALPAGVSETVMKALAKDPAERYPDAAAMRAAFAAVPAGASAGGGRREAPTIVEHATFAQETQATSPMRRLPAVGGVLAAVLIAALAFWLWPAASGVTLSVVTDPPGAVVTLGGERLGQTPIETVTSGTGRLRVERDGYRPVDTLLALAGGEPVALRFDLAALPPDQQEVRLLEVTSTPAGATVSVNGSPAGTTPLTYEDTTGAPVTLRLERAGYRPWTREGVELQPDAPTQVAADLQRVSEATPPPTDPPSQQPGTLVLTSRGGGTVRVAGQRATGTGTFSLTPGRHTVRCESPEYGPYETTVRVRAGQTARATCHFVTPVRVQANPASGSGDVWGEIWINGRNTQEFASKELSLGPGTYRVEVRREGYRVEPASHTITLRAGLEQPDPVPLIFEMKEQ
ncbi:MAG: PEGA domain-containing protein [Bacteroidota bacterium]